jgi:hypothetical protein
MPQFNVVVSCIRGNAAHEIHHYRGLLGVLGIIISDVKEINFRRGSPAEVFYKGETGGN